MTPVGQEAYSIPKFRIKVRIPNYTERVVAAVLQQPIGLMASNERLFHDAHQSWADAFVADRPDVETATVNKFLAAMWKDEFVASVDRAFIASCQVPLLVLPGTDDYHPPATGREVAALAPRAELLEPWKDSPELASRATDAVRRFLIDHAPDLT